MSILQKYLFSLSFRQQPSFHGVDLTSLRDAAVAEYFRQPVVVSYSSSLKISENYYIIMKTQWGKVYRLSYKIKVREEGH